MALLGTDREVLGPTTRSRLLHPPSASVTSAPIRLEIVQLDSLALVHRGARSSPESVSDRSSSPLQQCSAGRSPSAENVAVARAAYQAFKSGDLPGVGSHFADDAVWEAPDTQPTGGVIRGRDAVLER